MSLMLAAAAALPLISVAADDARLEKSSTFVSPAAAQSLKSDNGEQVLCLDRRGFPKIWSMTRHSNICLVRSEWAKASQIANAAPKQGPRAFIPTYDYTPPRPIGVAQSVDNRR